MFLFQYFLFKDDLKKYCYMLMIFSLNLYSQDYIWTGNGANTDFFNEENWIDVTTSQPPSIGTLEPSQVINKDLSISCMVHAMTYNETDITSQTTSIFDFSQSQDFPYVFTATTISDGLKSQFTQSVEINITFLPSNNEAYRVVKTVANGNWYNDQPQALQLGVNKISVSSVNFDRNVKIQFSSGEIKFDLLKANGENIFSPIKEPVILGSTNVLEIIDGELEAESLIGGKIIVNENAYLHLSGDDPIQNEAIIEFIHDLTWLKLSEVKPQAAHDLYMSQFFFNGSNVAYPSSIRFDNYYQNGTVVRPETNQSTPLIIYDGEALNGASANILTNEIKSGQTIPNQLNDNLSSFLLKRGHMATLAVNEDGTGNSKVFIASEEDLAVHSLPIELDNAVSFIRVIPWNWVSKKGTGGDITGMNNSWFYRWNNTGISDIQREYVPMSWGKGGADDENDILNYRSKYKATHILGFNEPDDCNGQSGQYSNMCDPEVAIGFYENLMKTGLRMISPAGRQGAAVNWINTFNNLGVQNDIRIDVIAVHWYDWYSDPQNSPNADPLAIFERFKNYLSNVYEFYGLPIWITEFNANKYRTSEVNEAFMRLAIPYLENTSYIERYAWFEPVPVNDNTNIGNGEFYDIDGNLSSIGLFYESYESTPSTPEYYYSGPNNLTGTVQLNQYTFACYPSNLLSVGYKLQMSNEMFKLFPNPANHLVQIQSKDSIDYIYIYNINGSLISKIEGDKLIDVSALESGAYIVKINNNYTKLIKH
jgi:hypothetical protein